MGTGIGERAYDKYPPDHVHYPRVVSDVELLIAPYRDGPAPWNWSWVVSLIGPYFEDEEWVDHIDLTLQFRSLPRARLLAFLLEMSIRGSQPDVIEFVERILALHHRFQEDRTKRKEDES